jgi:diguanylate cyclase (GGDEF)-like protein
MQSVSFLHVPISDTFRNADSYFAEINLGRRMAGRKADTVSMATLESDEEIPLPAPISIAAHPHNEAERSETLDRYHILDTTREQAYDDLTTLAAAVCGTPMSLLTFLGDRRQWFKSTFGMDAGINQTSRDVAFCAHTILQPDEILEVPDATQDERFAGNPFVTGEFGLRYYAGVPLLSPEGHAIGTLCVLDTKPNRLNEQARQALISLARQASAQLELRRVVAELESQSLIDPLTGVYNRRGFDRVLRQEWTYHARQIAPLSLLMLDADYFKSFNDAFGHPAGDVALKHLVRAVKQSLRPGDFVARFGGEEFCVLLQNTNEREAAQAAERIRAGVNGQQWLHRAVTVSVGVATVLPSETTDRFALIARADQALYTAKSDGRNRVSVFQQWDSTGEGRPPARMFLPYSASR